MLVSTATELSAAPLSGGAAPAAHPLLILHVSLKTAVILPLVYV
jgi:hypothetical protein